MVIGLDAPAIRQRITSCRTHEHHRFNSDAHALFKDLHRSCLADIRNIRIFMNTSSYTMTRVIGRNPISEGFDICLDRIGNVSDMIAGSDLGQSSV